jgi:hypothetical protein
MHGRVFENVVPCTRHLKKQTTNTAHFGSVCNSNNWRASVLSFLCYILVPRVRECTPCMHALGDIPQPFKTQSQVPTYTGFIHFPPFLLLDIPLLTQ